MNPAGDPEQAKARVQAQFGAHAQQYVTSQVHARGWSLARLLELVQPQANWRALDIATGGGHTALTFAPHLSAVVALDLTHAMLNAARRHATTQGASNLSFVQGDAEALPFAAEQFDLLTCRIAPHHFPDVGRFMREAARVVRPGGWVAVADNVTPDDKAAAAYINAFERLRDPSHHREYSLYDWLAFFHDAGLTVTHHESQAKYIDFDEWAARMSVTGENQTRLRVMLLQAPTRARQALAPRRVGSRLEFRLHEAILIGRRPEH